METEKLKDLLDEQVLIIDPRGKKKKQGTVENVRWSFSKYGECMSYSVRLNIPTIVKNKYNETIEYHRVIDTRLVEFINEQFKP